MPARGQLEDFPVSSISWSPDGKAFVYDDDGKVFIYDVPAKRSREIASGSTPEWSPDGKWISFRSSGGYASAIDSVTLASHDLFGRRKIRWGIHWSPDSRYVMLSEEVGFFSNLFHWRDIFTVGDMLVLRVEDGATAHVEWEYDPGIDDSRFYWVSDYRAFLKAVSIRPSINNCE
jgi:WD40 repeat protein